MHQGRSPTQDLLDKVTGLILTHDAHFPSRPDILVRKPHVLKTTVHVEPTYTAAAMAHVTFRLKNEFGGEVYVHNYVATPGGRAIKVCEVHSYAMGELISTGEITKQGKIVICHPITWRPLPAQKVLWNTKALMRRDQPNLHAVFARNVRARHW